MRRVKSFWRKDTKANLKINNQQNGLKGRVFGVPLDPLNPIIPEIVRQTTEYIEQHGIQEHGLFRVSGHHAHISALKQAFEKNESIDFSLVSTHAVANVLKFYLRELPEPLFTFNSYEALIASHGVTDPEMRLNCIKSIIQKVPPHYYIVLDYIIAFLHRICQHSNTNKMDSSNLAIVFAPNLLKSKTETAEQIVNDSPRSTSILKIIIENYSELFEKDPITLEKVETKPLKSYFSEDFLLPTKYETINLDKEIAEIFEEEVEDALSRGQIPSISAVAAANADNHHHHPHNHSSSNRPSVFQVFGGGSTSNTNSVNAIKQQSMDDTASSPDISVDGRQNDEEDDLDDEDEELKGKGHSNNNISPSLSTSPSSNSNPQLLATPSSPSNNSSSKNIDIKINGIKSLIDETIFKLEGEFIKLSKDLETELSFQEVLLIASSMKCIINILTDGPDIDTQVVSSFEIDTQVVSSFSESDSKRIETLKKAILLKITVNIPQLLEEIKQESYLASTQDEIEREICLVDLITIIRTLRAVNDVLDFFYNKWNQIDIISNTCSNTSITDNNINNNISNNNNNNNINSSNNNNNSKDSLLIIDQNETITEPLDKKDFIEKYMIADQILFETEESLMSISSKSELIFICKIIQNLQKIIKQSIKSASTFDEITPPKINTLKITPKQKLASLVSVVYVLTKEIRDQIIISKDSFIASLENEGDDSFTYTNGYGSSKLKKSPFIFEIHDKDLVFYKQRIVDLYKLLSRLPCYHTYKINQRNRAEISERNCKYMKETITTTLKKLRPLFDQLKQDANQPQIGLENLMTISRTVTKMKKMFEDPSLLEKTGIKFTNHLLLNKNSQLTLSSENFPQSSINDKVNALKSLSCILIDQITSRFNQLEKVFNQVNNESHLFEIINLLKTIIILFKDVKGINK
ncbi:hypothetical protein CYY_004561 [Polysphondylium violaceum]|uniref:Rho-GAP domain-containing protein n=1 Tax=Polysphondylium violaceum TaxID=133409 RepID=A0A8J4PWN9_9MYCE|nr:hypothetical protein CYY_004561 [Polysphondylium violaceum]